MSTWGKRAGFTALMLSCMLVFIGSCRKQVHEVADLTEFILKSPNATSVSHNVYKLGDWEWGRRGLDATSWQGLPLVAYVAPDGLNVAISKAHVPAAANEWDTVLLDSSQTVRFVSISASDNYICIPFVTGTHEELERKIAICAKQDAQSVLNNQAWDIQPISCNQALGIPKDAKVHNDTVAFICREPDTGAALYVSADLNSRESLDWNAIAVSDDQISSGTINLVFLEDRPAVSYSLQNQNALKLATAIKPHPSSAADWQVVTVVDNTQGDFHNAWTAANSMDGEAGMVFHQGEPAALRIALPQASAVGKKSKWYITTLADWGILGWPVLLSYHDIPLVAFDITSAIVVFEAKGPSPSRTKDWRMFFVSVDPKSEVVSEVKALIEDDNLLVFYGRQVPDESVLCSVVPLD